MATCGSTFSGIGCIDRGLERAGFTPRWQIEVDAACRQVLARHWPDVPRYIDVREVQGNDLAPVDLICGGFPCQDLSVAGRRAGLAGARSGLFYGFMRLVAERAPRWVLIENVPGLLSSSGGRDMAAVVGTLGELGYGWAYRVLDAQYFGVAQRRRRVWIVGCLGDAARASAVLFEPASCDGDTAPRRETAARVAATVTGGTGSARHHRQTSGSARDVNLIASGLTARYGEGTDSEAMDALTSGGGKPGQGYPTVPVDAISLSLAAKGQRLDGTVETFVYQCHGDNVGPMGALRRGNGGLGGGVPFAVDLQNTRIGGDLAGTLDTTRPSRGGGQAVAFHEDQRTGAVYENGHTHALSATGGGKPGQGYQASPDGLVVRRLTPTECERLMALPDGWTAEHPDTARYRMLGNGAVTTVVEWLGHRLLEAC